MHKAQREMQDKINILNGKKLNFEVEKLPSAAEVAEELRNKDATIAMLMRHLQEERGNKHSTMTPAVTHISEASKSSSSVSPTLLRQNSSTTHSAAASTTYPSLISKESRTIIRSKKYTSPATSENGEDRNHHSTVIPVVTTMSNISKCSSLVSPTVSQQNPSTTYSADAGTTTSSFISKESRTQ